MTDIVERLRDRDAIVAAGMFHAVPALREAADTIEQYQLLCGRLFDALMEYADPTFYHAIAFLPDAPCGGFVEDFDENFEGFTEHHYDYPKPGKLARDRLRLVQEVFGDLVVKTTNTDGE